MPVTPAHVVAVLPLVGRTGRVPAAALVVGSMAPDYPWFLTGGRTALFSHSLLGVVTVDLLVGLAAFVTWRRWLHDPVRHLLPRAVGERLPLPAGLAIRDLPWAALGVVVGALTHVAWDQFTHAGRAGTDAVPWLLAEHEGLPGFTWAQYLSGVLGVLVLLLWCVVRLSRSPRRPSDTRTSDADRLRAALVVAVAAVVGVGVGLATGGTRVETLAVGAVTRGGLATALAVALVCLVWRVRRAAPLGAPAGPGR